MRAPKSKPQWTSLAASSCSSRAAFRHGPAAAAAATAAAAARFEPSDHTSQGSPQSQAPPQTAAAAVGTAPHCWHRHQAQQATYRTLLCGCWVQRGPLLPAPPAALPWRRLPAPPTLRCAPCWAHPALRCAAAAAAHSALAEQLPLAWWLPLVARQQLAQQRPGQQPLHGCPAVRAPLRPSAAACVPGSVVAHAGPPGHAAA